MAIARDCGRNYYLISDPKFAGFAPLPVVEGPAMISATVLLSGSISRIRSGTLMKSMFFVSGT
jgi:hypothetical protein